VLPVAAGDHCCELYLPHLSSLLFMTLGDRARAVPRSERHSDDSFNSLNLLEILTAGMIFPRLPGDSKVVKVLSKSLEI